MVFHQDVGMNVARISIARIRKALQIEAVITSGKESGLTIVATLYNMLGNTRNRVSRLTGHRKILFQ